METRSEAGGDTVGGMVETRSEAGWRHGRRQGGDTAGGRWRHRRAEERHGRAILKKAASGGTSRSETDGGWRRGGEAPP